ncbi:MAG TPA: aminotransferase class V-fold PLP-dependent enzyme [Methylomirabilota bacterium]|nr:aminotransferase class V-fold PLP-dependent enzyme [Methylomirabilota bacterium]
MATATQGRITDWRDEWFEFEDATYLNMSTQGPMPKVALRAVQAALEWKKFPQHLSDAAYFEIPNRVRASLARLIGGSPSEIAITTGASDGMAAVALGLWWKPGDEILTGKGEFPAQFATWRPLEQREGVQLRAVGPRDRFLTADDFIGALTPKTRLVSLSLVRFDDGSRIDAARLAAACHAQGAYLLLDVSQCCGALPMDVAQLGADFVTSAGYKWLLGPYGTGFFWARSEHIPQMRPAPFYWMATEGADNFAALDFEQAAPGNGARRWDAAETPSFLNLAALDAALELVLRIGPETVYAHNDKLISQLFERLPRDRCVTASPLDPARRGPYGCFAARSPEKTHALFERLKKENVIVGLRQGNLRVSPHLYNTERDIDRVVAVITV